MSTELTDIADDFFTYLEEERGVPRETIRSLLADDTIPYSIFTEELGCLESIVKYLRNKGLTVTEITELIGRDPSTVSVTHSNAQEKHPGPLDDTGTLEFPVTKIRDADSILATLALHLRDVYDTDIAEIAEILDRSYNTIWKTIDDHEE